MFEIGQQRRLFEQPTARVRNADGSSALRTTIWYPAAPGLRMATLDVGPTNDPYMLVGDAAPDAPFANDERYPVILYSHGHNGSAKTTAWFGTALARAGYIVIAVDHPGNTMDDDKTSGGALMWWLRADDLRVAFEAVANDPTLGCQVDPERVGVAGFSMGGLTALMTLGGIFDGALFDAYCLAHPGCTVCPPVEALPLFEADNAYYPDPLKAEIARMTQSRRIPNAKAGFLIAPIAIGLCPQSLGEIDATVTIIVGSDDQLTTSEVGAQLAASLIPNASLVVVPGANHDSFINLCTPRGVEARYCECAAATEQKVAHRTAIAGALELFGPILKPN